MERHIHKRGGAFSQAACTCKAAAAEKALGVSISSFGLKLILSTEKLKSAIGKLPVHMGALHKRLLCCVTEDEEKEIFLPAAHSGEGVLAAIFE